MAAVAELERLNDIVKSYESVEDEASIAIHALFFLAPVETSFAIPKKLLDKWGSISSNPFNNQITLKCQMIRVIGTIFKLLNNRHDKDSFYQRLIGKFSIMPTIASIDPEIKIAALESLGTIFPYLNQDQKLEAFNLFLNKAKRSSSVMPRHPDELEY